MGHKVELPANADDYCDLHVEYETVWEILTEKCEIPASLEVFQHGLTVTRQHESLSPTGYARRLSAVYRRREYGEA